MTRAALRLLRGRLRRDQCFDSLAASRRGFKTAIHLRRDPRLKDFGRVIEDEFSVIQEQYCEPGYLIERSILLMSIAAPRNPIILAHGLLGFDELRLAGRHFPGIHYWRGISDALAAKDVEVITASVPPSGSIEARAARLGDVIAKKANGKSVNIIAHSMGGLDSRYMISQLKPPGVNVLSLTTIATPHRGSAFADYMFEQIGQRRIQRLYRVMDYFGLETGAFAQLTRRYMLEEFNPNTPDVEGVRYYSYGASLAPQRWSVFRPSHDIIKRIEGAENDGLVSVPSSQWGTYQGTLVGVSHIDLINWTNRLKWYIWSLTGLKRNFNAVALYLSIADMLAKEGL